MFVAGVLVYVLIVAFFDIAAAVFLGRRLRVSLIWHFLVLFLAFQVHTY